MPFYQEPRQNVLRFGDVLCGFVASIPKMKEPMTDHRHPQYQLDLSMPDFCVVLSPCCSIGASTITLVPLENINKNFYANPYLVEDFTRINRPVPAEKTVPPDDWDKFPFEEKEKRISKGNDYLFLEYFIFAEHDLLPKYTITYRKVNYVLGYYMIDFKKIFRVTCDQIKSPEESPTNVKLLQLTVFNRQDLRDKISIFYSRKPKEDLAELPVS